MTIASAARCAGLRWFAMVSGLLIVLFCVGVLASAVLGSPGLLVGLWSIVIARPVRAMAPEDRPHLPSLRTSLSWSRRSSYPFPMRNGSELAAEREPGVAAT